MTDVLCLRVEGFGYCYDDGDCEHLRAYCENLRALSHYIPVCNEGLACECGLRIKDEDLDITDKDNNPNLSPF